MRYAFPYQIALHFHMPNDKKHPLQKDKHKSRKLKTPGFSLSLPRGTVLPRRSVKGK